MSQQEHNRTISVRAFGLLCDEIPSWGILEIDGSVRQATPEEISEAMKNEYDIDSFYLDKERGKIVAILWNEDIK